MTPSVPAVLVAAYAVVLLAIAWGIDHFGARSARRAAGWRTGNFLYHEKNDAWKCHEDQWLYPAAFDPDKRVIRYEGQHAVCGRCPSKQSCSPTPGPREITRAIDPWPYSESGKFHRGLAAAVAAIALFLPAAMLFGAKGLGDLVVLGTTLVVGLAAALPLARHFWHTPDHAPEHLPLEGISAAQDGDRPTSTAVPVQIRRYASDSSVDALVDRYATKYGIGQRTPEPQTRKK